MAKRQKIVKEMRLKEKLLMIKHLMTVGTEARATVKYSTFSRISMEADVSLVEVSSKEVATADKKIKGTISGNEEASLVIKIEEMMDINMARIRKVIVSTMTVIMQMSGL